MTRTRECDIEIWLPTTGRSQYISLEKRVRGEIHCTVLSPADATRLGVRLIRAAGVVEQRRRERKAR